MEINLEERRLQLRELQKEPLNMKIQNTIAKVMEFYQNTNGNCYLSYSGGADSTVLKDIIERYVEPMCNVKIDKVFDDTGLEEPSVREMAFNTKDIVVVKPKKSFLQVLTDIGYPVISKEVSECVNNARKYFDKLDTHERERERECFAEILLSLCKIVWYQDVLKEFKRYWEFSPKGVPLTEALLIKQNISH